MGVFEEETLIPAAFNLHGLDVDPIVSTHEVLCRRSS